MIQKEKKPTWEAFIQAGYTPVHYRESSLDQIFMGTNVSCASYNQVDSNEYPVVIGEQTVPVSDHHFIYADLVFDFEAILANL